MMKPKIKLTCLSLSSPRVTRAERVLVLADLHQQVRPNLLSRWQALEPSLILIPGDWIEGNMHRMQQRESTLALLRSLTELCPVYYSLGNHEIVSRGDCQPLGVSEKPVALSAQTERLCEQLKQCGVMLLLDRFVRHGSLCVGGLTSAAGRFVSCDLLRQMACEEGFRLLLCHHPEYYEPYVRAHGLDLTVSGHAHGGQWRVFGRGVYAPGQGLFPRYTSGLYDDGHLLVSRGLAGRFPIPRVANPREDILLELLPRL